MTSSLSGKEEMDAHTPCRTCAAEAANHNFPVELLPDATYVGTLSNGLEWPLCDQHVDYAIIAGLNPKERVTGKKSAVKGKMDATESCGCVFCDIDLTPQEHDGKLMHDLGAVVRDRWAPCTKSSSPTPSLFISGYFTDRALAGDRTDPATGKVFNVNRKD